jgi:mannose-6-phosphate isomerase
MSTTRSADDADDPRLTVGDEAGTGERRPWGAYVVLDDGPMAKVKRITVDPGQRLSYQRHHRRREHWFVVAGTALVTLDDTDHEVGVGESIDIPLGAAHRVTNKGDEPLVFVEVQQGDYFGEDDIVRLDDDYGRADA